MEPVRILGWRRLGSLLVEEGLLTPDQLVQVFSEQRSQVGGSGRSPSIEVG